MTSAVPRALPVVTTGPVRVSGRKNVRAALTAATTARAEESHSAGPCDTVRVPAPSGRSTHHFNENITFDLSDRSCKCHPDIDSSPGPKVTQQRETLDSFPYPCLLKGSTMGTASGASAPSISSS